MFLGSQKINALKKKKLRDKAFENLLSTWTWGIFPNKELKD